MGLGTTHCCGDGQSACRLQITRDGATHSLGFTHDVPRNPSAADSREQQTFPFEQSFGPSQVIGAGQRRPQISARFTVVKREQQGQGLWQNERPQDTLAPAAILGCVQFGLVAE